MKKKKPTYEYNQTELIRCFEKAGVRIFDPKIYFNNYYVKRNFGIESVQTTLHFPTNGNIIFTLNNPKKFFLKVVKYGIL